MTFSVCPFCGEGMHGLPNMNDLGEWYAKNHPDLPVGSVIPSICRDCSHPYVEGEAIVTRDRSDTKIYSIQSLLRRANQPPLVNAADRNGKIWHFAVTQIRPYDERSKVNESIGPPKPGYF